MTGLGSINDSMSKTARDWCDIAGPSSWHLPGRRVLVRFRFLGGPRILRLCFRLVENFVV